MAKSQEKQKSAWVVYILECGDGTLYTGITNNLSGRIKSHENGTGAKYTKGRGPFKLFYSETKPNRSEASKRERQIKLMDKSAKMLLKQADAAAEQ